MFHGQKQSTPKAARAATEDSTFHPLPALFKLTGLSPFKKVSVVWLMCLLFIVLSSKIYKKKCCQSFLLEELRLL